MLNNLIVIDKNGKIHTLPLAPDTFEPIGIQDIDVDAEITRQHITTSIKLSYSIRDKYLRLCKKHFDEQAYKYQIERDAYSMMHLCSWRDIHVDLIDLWHRTKTIFYYIS